MARFHRIHGQQDNIRQMLSAAGVGDFNATMSLPYMYFLPRACDPFTQGVIQIVEGLQNLLNQKGARLVVNGWMGPETVKALRRYAGNGYRDKTWLQLYGDVMNGKIAPDHAKRERALAAQPTPAKAPASALAGLVDDSTMNPIAWLAAGGAAYYFLRGSRAHR